MLLSFPSGLIIEDTCTVQSLDKNEFNTKLNEKVSSGWVILEITSKFRRTLFGGTTSYRAELRRGDAK